jgi:hypothetical protein
VFRDRRSGFFVEGALELVPRGGAELVGAGFCHEFAGAVTSAGAVADPGAVTGADPDALADADPLAGADPGAGADPLAGAEPGAVTGAGSIAIGALGAATDVRATIAATEVIAGSAACAALPPAPARITTTSRTAPTIAPTAALTSAIATRTLRRSFGRGALPSELVFPHVPGLDSWRSSFATDARG